MFRKLSLIGSSVVWILLPKCSACLMAYMGLFSALGLGRLVQNAYTLPVIKILLLINLIVSVYLSVKDKLYGYAAISLRSAVVFVINKLYFESTAVNVVTCAVLIIAAMRIRLLGVRQKKCLFDGKRKMAC